VRRSQRGGQWQVDGVPWRKTQGAKWEVKKNRGPLGLQQPEEGKKQSVQIPVQLSTAPGVSRPRPGLGGEIFFNLAKVGFFGKTQRRKRKNV